MITEDYITWAEEKLQYPFQPHKVKGRSENKIFKLVSHNNSAYLKVGPGLGQEADRLKWLKGKVNAPSVIAFESKGDVDYLLISSIDGINLYELSKSIGPNLTVVKLVEALHQFHSIRATDCPFGNYKKGYVLTHGDACLPNFIYSEKGLLKGYIDLGNMGVDSPEVDLSAAIWTLQYNFGKGYGLTLLQEYGIPDASETKVDDLYQRYDQQWS